MLKTILFALPALAMPVVASAQDVMAALSGTWAEPGADCGDANNQWVVMPGNLITPFEQCTMTVESSGGSEATVDAKCLPREGGDAYSTNFTFEMTGASSMTIAGRQLFKELGRCSG